MCERQTSTPHRQFNTLL